jgi:uncharacterized protein (TIGR03437 family)
MGNRQLKGVRLLVLGALATAAVHAESNAVKLQKLHFEPASGDSAAKFIANAGQYAVGLQAGTVDFTNAGATLRLRFKDANRGAALEGEQLLPGKSFYYLGNDPSLWRSNVPQYARVRYRNLYSGVDAVFYGSADRQLEYDLILAPQADPSRIVLSLEGADKLTVTSGGDLEISAGGKSLMQRKPRVFQGSREIATSYRISGREVRFEVAPYDRSRPLVIDPVLAFASYLGGTSTDIANEIATDSAGNVYVTGQTSSPNFPGLAAGAGLVGGTDVFLAKFDPTGKTLLLTVTLGSSANDTARSMAIDAAGNVYLVGQTGGANFPIVNAFQNSPGSPSNGFVSKLNSAGKLVFSTFLGGFVSPPLPGGSTNTSTALEAVVPDSQGNIWVSGWTFATDFPSTLGSAPDPAKYPYSFVTGLSASGGLIQSMTFNNAYNNVNLVTVMALDSAGNIVLAGSTTGGLSTTAGVVQSVYGGGAADVFVARINPKGTSANYVTALTYLGGNLLDELDGMTLDAAGNVYLTGTTNSPNFPTTAGALERSLASGTSGAFIAELNPALTQETFATYLGGANGTEVSPRDIHLDPSGDIFVAGYTDFVDLTPAALGTNAGAVQPAYAGGTDGFIVELNPAGSLALYFTYFGGSAADDIFGMSLDSSGNLYAAGVTSSTNLPTVQPFQSAISTPSDAFFLRLNFVNPNAVTITSVNVAGLGSSNIAQNAWLEIHGINLAAAGTSAVWSSAPDFAVGKMPTLLSGVSVTVDGKPAFIYYVSPTQVNALTPLDSANGPVEIVLTSGTTASAPFTASMQAASPTFLLDGATRYIAATHADGSLLGAASLSAPGYVFTPAQPGETIVLYGAGFGLPGSPAVLVNGSSTQSGQLPVLPAIQIGGVAATVLYAGIAGPGLYQFNVTVPAATANGDIAVQASYGGVSTPAGDLITVHQ